MFFFFTFHYADKLTYARICSGRKPQLCDFCIGWGCWARSQGSWKGVIASYLLSLLLQSRSQAAAGHNTTVLYLVSVDKRTAFTSCLSGERRRIPSETYPVGSRTSFHIIWH